MKQQRQIDLKFYKAILASLSVVFLFVGFAPKTQAQDKYEPPPLPVDPTPLVQLLSETEKAWLARETNTKKLVETYLNISNSHLQVALSAINNDDFKTSERELDIYNKSLTEAAKLAFTHQNDKRKLAKKV